MMNIDVAAFDQSMAFISDSMPPLWKRLYDNLKAEGFTEEQAMELLKTYIRSLISPKGSP